jgi:2-hydroxychromene-2-carboxylate isomerase
MYRYCHWCAQQNDIPFKTPPAHPFNPLKVLRLAIALNADHNAIAVIFDHIWGKGNDIHTDHGFQILASSLGVSNAENLVSSDTIKQTLRDNTERAVATGVYGIPTFVINDVLFWGFDRTDMLLEYLKDPTLLQTSEMQRLTAVPSAAERKQ